jgi:hypothetical protein
MDEGAPQAAAVRTPEEGAPEADETIKSAVAALRHGWGDAYRIGWDAKRYWWARRRDGLGGDITAHDPDELWSAILDDYTLKPVPRLDPPAGDA